jgi:protein-S-isoprenylcysteine O-methyltransferase
MVANVLIFAVVFLLAPLLAGTDRLFHPGPWIGFVSALITLATQPPLSTSTLLHDARDRRSALLILVGAVMSQLIATIDFALRRSLFPASGSVWVLYGIVLATSGLALRLWAIRTLGRFFTSSVQVQAGQRVLSTGPYKLIRHPSYTGTLLTLLGIAISLGSLIGVALILLVNLPIYLYRIGIEERVLLAGLGSDYARYRNGTWRLVPFVL